MTEIKHYCDVCAEQIHERRTLLAVKTGPLKDARPEIDVCPDCLGRLTDLLAAFPATESGRRKAREKDAAA